MLAKLAAVAFAAMAGQPAAFALDPLSGAARAAGPTTVVVKGSRIRLAGLDPEMKDPRCGAQPDACIEAAQTALGELVATLEITCRPERRIGHGIYLGACALPDGSDLGERLIGEGWAVPAPDAPEKYRERAAEAAAAGRGAWAGS